MSLANAVAHEVARQVEGLPRRDIVSAALGQCRILVVSDLDSAVAVSNCYAPEHLMLAVGAPRSLLSAITNAGSVFLGNWTSEALGDYCSGTNHVLPTYGQARAWSGLSLQDFERRMTVQEATPAGLMSLAPSVVALAEMEGLGAHADSVRRRVARLAANA
jgi:histidinol dehydrogenase